MALIDDFDTEPSLYSVYVSDDRDHGSVRSWRSPSALRPNGDSMILREPDPLEAARADARSIDLACLPWSFEARGMVEYERSEAGPVVDATKFPCTYR